MKEITTFKYTTEREKETMKKYNRKALMFQQKLIGLGMAATSIGVTIYSGDATAAVLLVPLGLWLMLTKKLSIV